MIERLHQLIVPAYLFACLVLGGSAQGIWSNLTLQLGAIAILVWAGVTRRPAPLPKEARLLAWIAGGGSALILLQLVPLPPALWTQLPGRELVVRGFELLGQPLPWLPWSLTPYDTIAAALALLPPAAVIAGILRLGAYRSSYLAAALILGTLAGVLLGAMQVTSNHFYLYSFTSIGAASGFFANANYMGTLLLGSVPFLSALFARSRKQQGSRQQAFGNAGLIAGALLVVLIGILLNRSLAAAMLIVPVVLGSVLLLAEGRPSVRLWLAGGAALAFGAAVITVLSVPALGRGENAISVSTRQAIYGNSVEAAADMMPLGSGLGSFPRVYALYEDPAAVDSTFINHAHNDYLEFALDAGLPGVLLMLLFLTWWVRRTVTIWGSPTSGSFARAGTIASAAILAHSLVDFPLRTAAIAALFAMSVALMAEPRPRQLETPGEARVRPARHLRLR